MLCINAQPFPCSDLVITHPIVLYVFRFLLTQSLLGFKEHSWDEGVNVWLYVEGYMVWCVFVCTLKVIRATGQTRLPNCSPAKVLLTPIQFVPVLGNWIFRIEYQMNVYV